MVGNSYGGASGTQFASQSPNGDWHNCTLYAAYRLAQNGYTAPYNFENADHWAGDAPSGVAVNQTPAVGSIAQWNADGTSGGVVGHVAYVESVGTDYIDISEDNYVPTSASVFPGGYSAGYQIDSGSPDYPDNFIHYDDEVSALPVTGSNSQDSTDSSLLEDPGTGRNEPPWVL